MMGHPVAGAGTWASSAITELLVNRLEEQVGKWDGTWLQNVVIRAIQGMVTLWDSSQPQAVHGETDLCQI